MKFGVACKLLAMACTCVALAVPSSVGASTATGGTIHGVLPTYNGAVLFWTTGTVVGGHPACQGPGLTGRYAIDASTVAGQSMVAVLLSAQAQGKQIFITGSGTCTIWGDTETVLHFSVGSL
jgi:hypothetical protein